MCQHRCHVSMARIFVTFFDYPFVKKKRGPNIASSTFNSGFALKSFQVWENIPQSLILIGFQTN